MKWPWVSRERVELQARTIEELSSKVILRGKHNESLKETIGLLKAEILAHKKDITVLRERVETEKLNGELWKAKFEDAARQLPAFNTRKPRFHGPNGIAAQLTAASEEGSLESRQERAVAAVSQVPELE